MSSKLNPLSPQEKAVMEDGGTEPPFSGEYDNFFAPGTFICRRCNSPLFDSQAKFDAGCGWPSFDACFPGAVSFTPDNFDLYAEITCANCGGHLGHIFLGENFTPQNTRHCVNSLSLKFIPAADPLPNVIK